MTVWSGHTVISGQTVDVVEAPPPAGFPVNGILDNFNRANANPLDGNWTQGFQSTFDGNLKVESAALTFASGGVTDAATATWNSAFAANQEAYMDIVTRGGGSQHNLVMRVNGAGTGSVTGYYIQARTNENDIRVHRFDSAISATVLTTNSVILSDGDKVGCQIEGSVGTIYHYSIFDGEWVNIGTFDASAYTSSGKIGIALIGGASVADNFGGGNI